MPNRTLCVLIARVWQRAIANHNNIPVTSLCTNGRRAHVDWSRQVHARWSDGGKYKYKVLDIMKQWEKAFVESKIEEPRASIQHIVAHVLKSRRISDVFRNSNKMLSSEQLGRIQKMCRMRLNKIPVQYIINEWDFRNLTLKMRSPVFIPRPETEMLVDLVLQEIGENCPKVLELCCGSGAISLALLTSKTNLAVVTAVDKSAEACNLTLENAELYNVEKKIYVLQKEITNNDVENLLNFPGEKFDIIVSNPPYIPTSQLANVQQEILYEDVGALDGGEDGLLVIKSILRFSQHVLNMDGKIFLEVDPSHPEMIKNWLKANTDLQLILTHVHKDFLGRDRFVEIKKLI